MAATPPRSEADKRAAAIRKRDFAEIVLPFNAGQAQQASERCLQCGEHSICEWTCPLHNHIPQWIERVQAGDIDAAVALSHQTNCLPEITGRVCPQDRLCEGACTLRDEQGAVAAMVLQAQPLRQWLSILFDAWQQAEWPLEVWPDWLRESVPAKAVSAGGLVH